MKKYNQNLKNHKSKKLPNKKSGLKIVSKPGSSKSNFSKVENNKFTKTSSKKDSKGLSKSKP
jgi:predicted nucleic-acid-binding Zn-ribbon protein